jgi:hypothetical protein
MRNVPEHPTLVLQPALAAGEARRLRRQLVHAAAWLQGIWGDELALPAFNWDSLSQLPAWALCAPAQLERLALLTGTLFAAPALRRCLHAGPLLRVRALLGAAALERVLALPDDSAALQGPDWPVDEAGERDTLHAWGAALLAAGVEGALFQASLIRALSLSPVLVQRGLPPADLGRRMTALALEITAALSSPGEPDTTPPSREETAA